MPAKINFKSKKEAQLILNEILERATMWLWARAVELAPRGGLGENPYAHPRQSSSAIGELAARLDYEIDYGRMRGAVGLPMGDDLELLGWYNEYGCFFNEHYKILTIYGWKKFKDIKEGDLVYTHNGKWKKVLKKHVKPIDFVPEQIKITSETGKEIIVTPDHPLLVKRNNNKVWIDAKNIQQNDIIFEVYYNAMAIENNRKKISKSKKLNPWVPSEDTRRKMSKNHWTKNEIFKEKLKKRGEKHSIRMKGNKLCKGKRWKYKGEKYKQKKDRAIRILKKYANTLEAKKKQSDSLKETYKRNPEKHPNRIMAKRGFISKPQKELYDIIKRYYPSYNVKLEYPIRTKESIRFADVAVLELKLDFEYDGSHWHQNKEKDNQRDKELEDLGWKTIRIKGE